MFWGVILESGKRYSQKVSESYHLSMACLEALPGNTKPAKKEVYVMVEHGETEYILCVLEYGRVMQEKLDLVFDCGEVVTYFLNGEGVVHLTGYALAETKEENEILEKSTLLPAIKASNEDEDDDEEDDEDWTPSKEQIESESSEEESEESKDEESESESEPELVNREDEMDQPNETNEDDDRMKHKVATKANKPKKRKISETSPAQNGHLDNEEKTEKRKKVELNHLKSEDSEEESDSEPVESEDDDDDDIDEEDSSMEEGSENEEISSAGRTPMPNRKVGPNSSLGGSPNLQPAQKKPAQPQQQQKNKLKKTSDISSTNKGTVPVTPKNARKLPGNVQVEDLRTGKGPQAKSGRLVFFHYVGKFLSGRPFETCEGPDEPFSFRMGRGEVIKGLDVGLEGMHVGGKRRITIPPHMGYGIKGADGIPPDTTLVFTVELKAVK